MEKYFDKFIAKCKEENIELPVTFVPYVEEIILSSIQISRQCGSKYIVITSLFNEVGYNYECYSKLAEIAKKNDMMILFENELRNNNGHLIRGNFSDEFEIKRHIDMLNEKLGCDIFGFCLNLRNAFICKQDVQNFIVTLKNRLKVIIVSDDEEGGYVLPFLNSSKGIINNDWLGFIRGVREIEFEGEIILDFRDMTKVFSGTLRKALLDFAKSISDYLCWQINIEKTLKKYKSIVLFGAGNMCKNYIRCYGEKYPPLFICDNNEELWGKELYGLAIKSPDSLRSIAKQTGIFICSTFYDEIYEQLKNMKIQNNIEFFSDEFMPMFYQNIIKRNDKV